MCSGGRLNISSALIKQVVSLNDFETWSYVKKEYLPTEYHRVFDSIDKHVETFHRLPSFDDLKLSVRDASTKDKVYAVEAVEVDVDAGTLLEYLKNEFTQREILKELEQYIDSSLLFESAEESVSHLHQIVLDIENRVDLEVPSESMQRISLWESDEELERYVALGLNRDYDHEIKFSPRDLILVGGRRGAGKSLTCANLAQNVVETGKSVIYFTIEMDSRNILQRICAIATGLPFSRLRTKTLSIPEWERVAVWWASRFENSESILSDYRQHRDFEKFHHKLTTTCQLLPTKQIDVIYDPSLTLSKIRAELDKKVKQNNVGLVIVDYLNQVKRSAAPSRGGQYDWTEQIEVSKALKAMAQEYEVPVFSPYQTDASGEARFAKGILDAADAAYSLEAWSPEDNCVTFNCVKMRNAAQLSFTSVVDWSTLKIGPETAMTPKEKESTDKKTGESISDL